MRRGRDSRFFPSHWPHHACLGSVKAPLKVEQLRSEEETSTVHWERPTAQNSCSKASFSGKGRHLESHKTLFLYNKQECH